jgi:hypothetical protein
VWTIELPLPGANSGWQGVNFPSLVRRLAAAGCRWKHLLLAYRRGNDGDETSIFATNQVGHRG